MRPSKRYFFLKQNFLWASVAAQPTLETLKAQLQDIETDLKKNSVDDKSMMGQGHRADGEINGAKDPRLTTTAGIADAAANADAAMVEDVKTTKPIEAAEAKKVAGTSHATAAGRKDT